MDDEGLHPCTSFSEYNLQLLKKTKEITDPERCSFDATL